MTIQLAPDDELAAAFIHARPSWMASAACKGIDAGVFFPKRGWRTTDDAKAICSRCDVLSECLTYALENREKEGVWGGKSAGERRSLR